MVGKVLKVLISKAGKILGLEKSTFKHFFTQLKSLELRVHENIIIIEDLLETHRRLT